MLSLEEKIMKSRRKHIQIFIIAIILTALVFRPNFALFASDISFESFTIEPVIIEVNDKVGEYYDTMPDDMIVYVIMSDGYAFSGSSASVFESIQEQYNCTVEYLSGGSDQSPENSWDIGTHSATVKVGLIRDSEIISTIRVDYEVIIVSSIPCEIIADPENCTVEEGETAHFSVWAEGSGLSYAWQYKTAGSNTWRNCSSKTKGYNTNEILVEGILSRSGYHYRCIVTEKNGDTMTSAAALLTVEKRTIAFESFTIEPINIEEGDKITVLL